MQIKNQYHSLIKYTSSLCAVDSRVARNNHAEIFLCTMAAMLFVVGNSQIMI